MNFDDVVTFDNGDDPYFEWLKQNKKGSVVNAEKSGKPVKLHRADCYHINPRDEVKPDAYTKGPYIKICSPSMEHLLASVRHKYEKFGDSALHKCGACNP